MEQPSETKRKARKNSRIVTRDDVSRAIVEQVKTDAMFGAGKPRFKVSSHVLPKVGNSNFDVAKLIRDTIKDLSYTHPILNRRFNQQSREQKRQQPSDDDESEQMSEPQESQSEEADLLLSEVGTLDLEVSIASPERFTPITTTAAVPTEPLKKAVVLPSIYNHQGNTLQRKDYTPTRYHTSHTNIDINEAGKYHYIRAMPHQLKKLSSTSL